MGWKSAFHPETARTVLGTMASSMFTFIVFVSSALLVAVQLASAQLTPRIIAFMSKDPVMKFSLTVFVFTFTLSLAVLVRIKTSVPMLTAELAAYSCLASLGVFLYLIDHVGRSLRPSGALRSVAQLGRKVIERVYPQRLTDSPETSLEPANLLAGEPTCTIPNPRDGVVLALEIQGLVSLAQRADCVIEMVPQVGEFVAAEDALSEFSKVEQGYRYVHCANRSPLVRNVPWSKTRALRSRVVSRVRAVQEEVLLFSSGHFLRVFAARWLGLEPGAGRYFLLSTAILSALGDEHNLSEPVIRGWDETHHVGM